VNIAQISSGSDQIAFKFTIVSLIFSDLKITKKIGEGVYGEVFSAVHGQGDLIALKVNETDLCIFEYNVE